MSDDSQHTVARRKVSDFLETVKQFYSVKWTAKKLANEIQAKVIGVLRIYYNHRKMILTRKFEKLVDRTNEHHQIFLKW